MPEYDYTCTSCGTTTPVELCHPCKWDSDSEYPPEVVHTICGERWGGCGRVHDLELVEGSGPTFARTTDERVGALVDANTSATLRQEIDALVGMETGGYNTTNAEWFGKEQLAMLLLALGRPNAYRQVETPDEWEQWSTNAKVNYLASAMDRDQLLSTVGELAGIPDDEIGEQSILKTGLAQLVIVLEECGRGGDDA